MQGQCRIHSMISAGYQGILATGISRNMFLPKNLPGATALYKLNHVTMSGTGLRLRIDCPHEVASHPSKWPFTGLVSKANLNPALHLAMESVRGMFIIHLRRSMISHNVIDNGLGCSGLVAIGPGQAQLNQHWKHQLSLFPLWNTHTRTHTQDILSGV